METILQGHYSARLAWQLSQVLEARGGGGGGREVGDNLAWAGEAGRAAAALLTGGAERCQD